MLVFSVDVSYVFDIECDASSYSLYSLTSSYVHAYFEAPTTDDNRKHCSEGGTAEDFLFLPQCFQLLAIITPSLK